MDNDHNDINTGLVIVCVGMIRTIKVNNQTQNKYSHIYNLLI